MGEKEVMLNTVYEGLGEDGERYDDESIPYRSVTSHANSISLPIGSVS
jgi:hypothetical protein